MREMYNVVTVKVMTTNNKKKFKSEVYTMLKDIIESWKNTEGKVNSMEDILSWIEELNNTTHVDIKECSLGENTFWFYDDYNGEITNRKKSFFSIKGIRRFDKGHFTSEQPVIIQPEIGYLGIICQKIDGVLHFLMQAKIEPGNVNCIQISPTIQATKSNFTRAHGGKMPLYFEYFENAGKYNVLYDQIQSEQASRFLHKRNRNIIIEVPEKIEVHKNFKWMTIGQVKALMDIENLVNMDTRTVMSGLPLYSTERDCQVMDSVEKYFDDKSLFKSMFETNAREEITRAYLYINDYKMFHDVDIVEVPLNQLVDWEINDSGIYCTKKSDFTVKYYDIAIEGREVQRWVQPLFKANGSALFGLIEADFDGVKKFLVRAMPEMGSFDKIEFGPSVQKEFSDFDSIDNVVEKVFYDAMKKEKAIITDVVLSEEGGRFFHEQNRNVIVKVEPSALSELPNGYFWLSYGALNYMVQINNCLNIQLRNLLSMIKI
jgi:oxidase EvaA